MDDMNGFIIFAMGSVFGIIMSYAVCDLVFPPIKGEEDENDTMYS